MKNKKIIIAGIIIIVIGVGLGCWGLSKYFSQKNAGAVYENLKDDFDVEPILDIPQVENMFVTPRTFNYYMSRKSSEEWEAEQKRDQNNYPAINISVIESGVRTESTDRMLIHESGKSDYRRPSDIDICTEID